MTPLLTRDVLIEWINHYEEGNDIPDDVMVSILFMAQRDADLTTVREYATKWRHEAGELEDEHQAIFDESDCSEAMHSIDEYRRVGDFLSEKISELPKYPGVA